jgi:hypothetical protein
MQTLNGYVGMQQLTTAFCSIAAAIWIIDKDQRSLEPLFHIPNMV